MTIKEALTSTVNFPLPDTAIEKALIDNDLNGSETYAKSDAKAVGVCMAGLLFTLITSADVTEDDVWIKLPQRDVLLRAYSSLCRKWGIPDEFAVPTPTVKQVRLW
ncbi:DUF6706 family protein [Mucilaginibacter sabulilitoris]|uniref:DUF6706 family protein n=1 Tax=Mucilaginibacter sabulilitoris TaxID=1173583 RepID=A0ABZ0TFR6_9SPHI|nr:DUF6706 family protein [Mucilaginibacter sabulilitoris]WPU91797.1 DUF6706 family protein [Mucilaginibacter sabulilitoris]